MSQKQFGNINGIQATNSSWYNARKYAPTLPGRDWENAAALGARYGLGVVEEATGQPIQVRTRFIPYSINRSHKLGG